MDLIVSGYLLELSIEDMRKRKLTLWILGIGFIGSVLYSFIYKGISGMVMGIIPGVILIILSVLLPQSIGIGDGMLAVIYGVVYGWQRACFWLICGFLLVAVFGVFVSLFHREKCSMLPFVPFLTLVHVGMCL